jgi:ribose-phosphate pyrophosphokinase
MGIKIFGNGSSWPYELTKFPGGEINVRLGVLPNLFSAQKCVTFIYAYLRSSDDIMALLLVTDALRRYGVRDISITIPYLPYARQDRVCNHGESLSLKVLCDLINSQEYRSVTVWDVHSDVSLALLNNVVNLSAINFLSPALSTNLFDPDRTIFVAPDAGAIKKVAELSKRLSVSFIRADKTRNPATGEIAGTTVYSGHVGNQDFLIVDDICDGGRTFTELAAELRPLTTGKLMLYVTHGIFSKGTSVFDGVFDSVFVANSFLPASQLPGYFHILHNQQETT